MLNLFFQSNEKQKSEFLPQNEQNKIKKNSIFTEQNSQTLPNVIKQIYQNKLNNPFKGLKNRLSASQTSLKGFLKRFTTHPNKSSNIFHKTIQKISKVFPRLHKTSKTIPNKEQKEDVRSETLLRNNFIKQISQSSPPIQTQTSQQTENLPNISVECLNPKTLLHTSTTENQKISEFNKKISMMANNQVMRIKDSSNLALKISEKLIEKQPINENTSVHNESTESKMNKQKKQKHYARTEQNSQEKQTNKGNKVKLDREIGKKKKKSSSYYPTKFDRLEKKLKLDPIEINQPFSSSSQSDSSTVDITQLLFIGKRSASLSNESIIDNNSNSNSIDSDLFQANQLSNFTQNIIIPIVESEQEKNEFPNQQPELSHPIIQIIEAPIEEVKPNEIIPPQVEVDQEIKNQESLLESKQEEIEEEEPSPIINQTCPNLEIKPIELITPANNPFKSSSTGLDLNAFIASKKSNTLFSPTKDTQSINHPIFKSPEQNKTGTSIQTTNLNENSLFSSKNNIFTIQNAGISHLGLQTPSVSAASIPYQSPHMTPNNNNFASSHFSTPQTFQLNQNAFINSNQNQNQLLANNSGIQQQQMFNQAHSQAQSNQNQLFSPVSTQYFSPIQQQIFSPPPQNQWGQAVQSPSVYSTPSTSNKYFNQNQNMNQWPLQQKNTEQSLNFTPLPQSTNFLTANIGASSMFQAKSTSNQEQQSNCYQSQSLFNESEKNKLNKKPETRASKLGKFMTAPSQSVRI